MSNTQLVQINTFPIKSIAPISLSNAWVERQGIVFDRRFMIALPSGMMVTARKYPQLVKVNASLLADGLVISAGDKSPLYLRYDSFEMKDAESQVWKDKFIAYTTTEEANIWFSELLGRQVKLLYTGEQSNRVRDSFNHNVSFADGYPLLVISRASLEELNRRSGEVHSMDQFRTNLVVDHCEAFAEDSWKRIKIGDVEFENRKPCQRCILTTVDVNQGELRSNKEPMKTLQTFRADERGGVYFGQNLIALNEGKIAVGDAIDVLEYQESPRYNG
uniref:MOSC domain-containing protein n=1 Tax=Thaumasiovibrio subtropicus TaxID=1891207 RepID=UPI000B35677B|nr:MOSC domain-containing protein [Thaumasiovibrio subtropicus]